MDQPNVGSTTEIIPYLFYRDVSAALDWLARTFGFTEEMRHTTPSGGTHAQMTFGGRRIMMGQGGKQWNMLSPAETRTPTQGVFIYLDDVGAHYERARTEGAAIDAPPSDQGYGLTYTARDMDGHPWFFTQRPAP